MKRPLLVIAICLLLGAVVNVAVAWGCAVGAPSDLKQQDGHLSELHDDVAQRFLPSVRVKTGYEIRGYELRGFGWSDVLAFTEQRALENSADDREGAADVLFHITATGWPMRALSGHVVEIEGRKSRHGLWLPSGSQEVLVLPFRPIWPGFAFNTLFYAAILWPLFCGPFALRRFLRVRRGLCPKCAYPMGESSVCTECGCGLPTRARTP